MTAASPLSARDAPVVAPARARAWLLAARPATLWAAVAPVAVGTACAALHGGVRAGTALVALFGALALQVGANFVNDLADFERGADAVDRIGPARAVQSGWLTARDMGRGAILAFGAAAIAGLWLARVAGPIMIPIWIAAIAAGVSYTAGPRPLAYLGLGDLFVFLFFGPVAVVGTTFVQTGSTPALAWWSSMAVGSLATAILVVNNLRDRETDRRADKRTLAVRFGAGAARAEYVALLAAAWLTPAVLALRLGSPWLLLPWLSTPLALVLLRRVLQQDGPALNPALGGTARLLLVFSLLLTVAIVASA